MEKRRVPSEEEQSEVRDEYSRRIQRLILGPGSEKISRDIEEEVISENPKTRYVTGILYPEKDALKDDDSNDTVELEQAGDVIEDPIAVDNNFKASSMGITFYCKTESPRIKACIKTAAYKRVYNKVPKPFVDVDDDIFRQLKDLKNISILEFDEEKKSVALSGNTKEEIEVSRDSLKKVLSKKDSKTILSDFSEPVLQFMKTLKNLYYSKSFYKREPYSFEINVNVGENGSEKQIIRDKNKGEDLLEVFDKIQVMHGHDKSSEKIIAVTIVIKNLTKKPLFQSEIMISKQSNMCFCASEDVKLPDLEKLQDEDAMNIFLYRKNKTYASGHGVSACWDQKEGEVSSVFTSYIPSYEIMPTNTENEEVPKSVLDPANYIGKDHQEQIDKLAIFIGKYEKWVKDTEKNAGLLKDDFRKLALKNVKQCMECVTRMRETLAFLQADPAAFTAFNIANETMLLQRMKDYHQKERAYKTKDYSNVDFYWRPFQLAFVLNSLESVLNPKSSHRNDLDLIWVPTGGGKTEAYLFAIAAVITYRRLTRKKGYEGVTVIMRYTLRLLTSQQFERAAKMICALEYIRKIRGDLGKTEISIGLWIGEGTENKLKKAKADFGEMCNSKTLDEAKKKNKFQILTCPWCGKKHSIIPEEKDFCKTYAWGYKAVDKPLKKVEFNMVCLTKDCPFHSGLPIYVVDESIYKVRPTLVFGTVDKFAQIPLKEEAQRLFGSDNPQKYNRPDLIVQDELHLISGPLGSIVGLYEAGFDYILHDNSGQGPKYIASTATIRNADDQIKGIFDRKTQLFPPRGITESDNFFIRETKRGHGRKYFGIMGTGKSQMTVEVHMIAAMLQCSVNLGRDASDEELFWTIAGYFNSLRELGKASSLIRDDVRDYLRQLKTRLSISDGNFRTLFDSGAKELTSRIAGNQIPDIIEQLGVPHDEIQESGKHNLQVIDTLLATNMLSVGIDISRLNAMLVIGQPKLTSEYIQATSRVGRKSLGAVFTLYNSTRSRDRSHYETFQAYHQNLYKYVEPSSVTPFSVPAMMRGIPGVIVSMLRNTVERLSGDTCPQNILDGISRKQLNEVQKFLMKRVEDSEDKYHLYRKDAKRIIDEFIEKWEQLAKKNSEDEKNPDQPKFRYYKYLARSDEYGGNLLLKSFNDKSHLESMNVMESMRSVEDTSFVNIKGDVEK